MLTSSKFNTALWCSALSSNAFVMLLLGMLLDLCRRWQKGHRIAAGAVGNGDHGCCGFLFGRCVGVLERYVQSPKTAMNLHVLFLVFVAALLSLFTVLVATCCANLQETADVELPPRVARALVAQQCFCNIFAGFCVLMTVISSESTCGVESALTKVIIRVTVSSVLLGVSLVLMFSVSWDLEDAAQVVCRDLCISVAVGVSLGYAEFISQLLAHELAKSEFILALPPDDQSADQELLSRPADEVPLLS